jgi:phage baseplate assembly protein W
MAVVNTNLSFKSPIGLSIPIKRGIIGYFDATYDSFSKVKMNILNLLKTKRGERRLNPLFGTKLAELVFEQNTDSIEDIASNIVRDEISRWIPDVSVTDVNVVTNTKAEAKDTYRLYVKVTYKVNSTNQENTVDIIVDQNSI